MQLLREQKQIVSPQMQQSLQILQAPLMDLRSMVAQELLENPVLEETSVERSGRTEESSRAVSTNDEAFWGEGWGASPSGNGIDDFRFADERHRFFTDSVSKPVSLSEEVERQVRLMSLSLEDAFIARAIAGSLDARGYFVATPEELAKRVGVASTDVERVLKHVQRELDPSGLAARDLRECLLLQLDRLGKAESLEARVVSDHLEDLARKKLTRIARVLNASPSDIQQAANSISRLDPKPGRLFDFSESLLVVPEVIVERGERGFEVRLNKDELPAIRISDNYKDMIGDSAVHSQELHDYLREKLRSGRLFLKSIEERNETMLRIAIAIVEKQQAFLEEGLVALQPMTMAEVANAIGVHETTVGRAVAGKYMQTPQGLFEMRSFFTSGYTVDGGQLISSESVRQAIQDLIRTENTSNPLSDQEIMQILSERGVSLNRRTVAKYRDQLGILPSHLRKRN